MLRRCTFPVGLILFLMVLPLAATAQDKAPPPQQPAPPPAIPFPPALPEPPPMDRSGAGQPPTLKMVASGVYEMGDIKILKKEGQVRFPAVLNMQQGLLEYLLVGKFGKVHESLLRTDVEPYSLQIALLLMGLEGTQNPLAGQGDPKKPQGDPVTLWVEWKDGEKTRKVPVEEWVVNRQDGKPLKPMQWVFTGSFITEGVFMAQVDKSMIAVFRDPAALIDNPLPEGASDEIWFVNDKAVPPMGTEVSVIIQKAAK